MISLFFIFWSHLAPGKRFPSVPVHYVKAADNHFSYGLTCNDIPLYLVKQFNWWRERKSPHAWTFSAQFILCFVFGLPIWLNLRDDDWIIGPELSPTWVRPIVHYLTIWNDKKKRERGPVLSFPCTQWGTQIRWSIDEDSFISRKAGFWFCYLWVPSPMR